MTEIKIESGKKYKVVESNRIHQYSVGEIVTFLEDVSGNWLFTNGTIEQFLVESEIEPFEDTTPQPPPMTSKTAMQTLIDRLTEFNVVALAKGDVLRTKDD